MERKTGCFTDIIKEQVFIIGEKADVKVTAVLKRDESGYRMTFSLGGIQVIDVENFGYKEGMTDIEILSYMEKIIDNNEDFLVVLSSGH